MSGWAQREAEAREDAADELEELRAEHARMREALMEIHTLGKMAERPGLAATMAQIAKDALEVARG